MTAVSAASEPGRTRLHRLSWIAVLVLGVAAYLVVLRTAIATQNVNFIPSLLLLGSAVVPGTVLTFAATGGRRIVVSSGLLALVAILGGIIGTVAAGTLEYDALRRLRTLPMIFVGLIEESAKLVVPLLVLLISRYRGAAAGVVIGVASGMGFATLETMGYGFTALLKSGSIAALDSTLLLRALLSPAGHVAWTGMTAAALFAIGTSTRHGRAVLRFVGDVRRRRPAPRGLGRFEQPDRPRPRRRDQRRRPPRRDPPDPPVARRPQAQPVGQPRLGSIDRPGAIAQPVRARDS